MKLSETLGLTAHSQETGSAEIVVLHTGLKYTPAAIEAAASLTKGLDFHLVVIAVHILPYPLQLKAVSTIKEHLEKELEQVTAGSSMPVDARIVFARDIAEAFRQGVRPESLVLVGSPQRWWSKRARQWAKELAEHGFRTAIIDVGRAHTTGGGIL
jgi:hypothetical protein